MDARQQIADFLSALIWVYTLCLIAWIVAQFVFSLGGRMPYNRPLNAVLDFLRDVSEPYLRIFRRLGLRAGPFDFSPIRSEERRVGKGRRALAVAARA